MSTFEMKSACDLAPTETPGRADGLPGTAAARPFGAESPGRMSRGANGLVCCFISSVFPV